MHAIAKSVVCCSQDWHFNSLPTNWRLLITFANSCNQIRHHKMLGLIWIQTTAYLLRLWLNVNVHISCIMTHCFRIKTYPSVLQQLKVIMGKACSGSNPGPYLNPLALWSWGPGAGAWSHSTSLAHIAINPTVLRRAVHGPSGASENIERKYSAVPLYRNGLCYKWSVL